MDPLLERLLPARHSRARPLLVVGAVLLGLVVLGIAVVVAGSASTGSSVALPSVRLERAASASPTPLLVQVGGAVRRPGLVAVPDGARVVDAVAAAGGPTGKADQGGVNLAARVADGQQIVVPERGAVTTAAPGASTGAMVSLGAATQEQLESLPGIGPALAQRILAYRTEHGGFRSVDELQQVSGIGPVVFAGLKDRVAP